MWNAVLDEENTLRSGKKEDGRKEMCRVQNRTIIEERCMGFNDLGVTFYDFAVVREEDESQERRRRRTAPKSGRKKMDT